MITWIALPALLMPVILLGGIYSGIMTPTEAAAVGAAAYAFLVGAVWYRNISLRQAYDATLSSARVDGFDRHADRRCAHLQLCRDDRAEFRRP